MKLELNGNLGLKLDKKTVIDVTVKEKKVILNIRKIKGLKKILGIIKIIGKDKEEKSEPSEEEASESSEDTTGIDKVLDMVTNKGYKISIKVKGITIIRDLESSSLQKLSKLL
ncbi:MAG: hypothetical protein BTN85_1212 [Candidatus Methanohalarchaeum thermophilum]|uniref:Uncharacterized protein n=1 Tax=Methanohalarchaeum thermophilum TaxID=1903181 RepID=A0A1Q6DWJ3_METT1|nr:MAG: hypothetical protein BTN85_1212 [Candidatus Methanohalarchaeum thermophilum]